MSRTPGSVAAGLLAVVLCLGVSTGPALADARKPTATEPTEAGVTQHELSGLLTLLIGSGLALLARRGPNGPGSRRT